MEFEEIAMVHVHILHDLFVAGVPVAVQVGF